MLEEAEDPTAFFSVVDVTFSTAAFFGDFFGDFLGDFFGEFLAAYDGQVSFSSF